MSTRTTWDTELYEAKHDFVWKLGTDVVELLDPKPGERILDIGCGTGHLTAKIRDRGATAIGLDSSPDMIGQARQNFPDIKFVLGSAAEMTFSDEFNGVFSNAALHWMLEADAVVNGVAKALHKGGRFAAEFGGKGNIPHIMEAIEQVLPKFYEGAIPKSRTYFPSISTYSSLLETNGLEVQFAHLFDRPTPLDGENGMGDWLRQFKWYYFEPLRREDREQALREVVDVLRPVQARNGRWMADYRRLRILAVKP